MASRPSRIACVLSVLATLACVATTTTADAADAPPEYVPGIVRPDTLPVQERDPRTVIPTDTVVEPPLPDTQLEPWLNGNLYFGWVVPGPNIAWGLIGWNLTSAGPVVGARVTLTHLVDGWRYSTTTDRFGRWRMAVPDGPYATEVVPRSQDAPYGVLSGADGRVSYWGTGLGHGWMQNLVARPRHSCAYDGRWFDGAEGWAPGTAPGSTTCAYATDPTLEGLGLLGRFMSQDTIVWALSGRDPAPVDAPAGPVPPTAPPVVRPAARTSMVLPVVVGGARVARGGTVRVRVACADGVSCSGGLALTAPAPRTRASRSTPAVLARGTLRRGPSARLLITSAGRRATRRRAVRTRVVWTPTGGAPMVIGFVRLRPAAR